MNLNLTKIEVESLIDLLDELLHYQNNDECNNDSFARTNSNWTLE